jgi:hypothetical protein
VSSYDGNTATHLALRLLAEEDPRWQSVTIRVRRYLNNVVEQDHRAIKQRYRPMLGLKSFRTAAITFSGIELAHRIRKRQFAIAYDYDGRSLSLKELWAQALSGKSLSGNADNTPPPLRTPPAPSIEVALTSCWSLSPQRYHRCLKRQTAALQPASV